MAGGIVYLDADDEITSAAARIREVAERRVALVLPYGSRVATSRINFRLLSRDAMVNEKQLAVVAADSATRALAASAGLPVFASVGEYEASLPAKGVDPPAPPPAVAAPPSGTASEPDASTQIVPVPAPGAREARSSPSQAAAEETAQVEIPWEPKPPEDRPWTPARTTSTSSIDHRPQPRPGLGRASRLPIVIVLAALALVLLVGGVGAYVVLPSVSIVVTPQAEGIALPAITVTADPNATEPDAAARVVPARVVPLEVTVRDTFPATGKRVEEEIAKGAVRFSNLDFLRTNTVPKGSIVSTNAGVRFRTVAEVTVPRADLVGLTVFPGRITVNVTAVEPGTAGNVEPNTILTVPQGEDPQALKVVNPNATTGGTHEEFPLVAQEDVDAAIEQLTTALTASFQARLLDPAIAPTGATVFADTATLGEPTPDVDPTTLVGQEIETFEVGLSATGTVVTVDPGPVTAIADELMRAKVEPGHELVAGSIQVEVRAPVVSGQTVAFSASATGAQIAILDAGELRALVMGKPLDAARAVLAPYGDVQLTAWPDWVGSVPTIADRVDVQVDESVPVETPDASGSTS